MHLRNLIRPGPLGLILVVVFSSSPAIAQKPAKLKPNEIELTSLRPPLLQGVSQMYHRTVGVGQFTGPNGTETTTSRKLADIVANALTNSGVYTVLDRNRFEQVLEELKLGMSGLLDENQIAKAGKLLGAHVIAVGRIQQDQGQTVQKESQLFETNGQPTIRTVVSYNLSLTVQFIDVELGATLDQFSLNLCGTNQLIPGMSKKACEIVNGGTGSNEASLLQACLTRASVRIRQYVGPFTTTEIIELKGSGAMKKVIDQARIEFQVHREEKGVRILEEALTRPNLSKLDRAVMSTNIGHCRWAMGQYCAASERFAEAYTLQPMNNEYRELHEEVHSLCESGLDPSRKAATPEETSMADPPTTEGSTPQTLNDIAEAEAADIQRRKGEAAPISATTGSKAQADPPHGSPPPPPSGDVRTRTITPGMNAPTEDILPVMHVPEGPELVFVTVARPKPITAGSKSDITAAYEHRVDSLCAEMESRNARINQLIGETNALNAEIQEQAATISTIRQDAQSTQLELQRLKADNQVAASDRFIVVPEPASRFSASAVHTVLHTFSHDWELDTFRVITKEVPGGYQHLLEIRSHDGRLLYKEEFFVGPPSSAKDARSKELEELRVRNALSPSAFRSPPWNVALYNDFNAREERGLDFEIGSEAWAKMMADEHAVGFVFHPDEDQQSILVYLKDARNVVNIAPIQP